MFLLLPLLLLFIDMLFSKYSRFPECLCQEFFSFNIFFEWCIHLIYRVFDAWDPLFCLLYSDWWSLPLSLLFELLKFLFPDFLQIGLIFFPLSGLPLSLISFHCLLVFTKRHIHFLFKELHYIHKCCFDLFLVPQIGCNIQDQLS